MKKVEAQRSQVTQRAAQRQSGGTAFESPQGEQIAQLEAMVDASQQVGGVARFASMANNGPQATAQRRTMGMIGNSSRMAVPFRQPILQEKSVHAKSPTIQRKILIGYTEYIQSQLGNDKIPNYDRLVPKVKNKIEAWAKKDRNMPFANWNDVIDTALRVTGTDRADMYQKRAFNTNLDNMVQPTRVVKAGRTYWLGGIPTFAFGGQYYNSNDARFKKTQGGREVHATLNSVDEVNISNELVAHVKAQPAWTNRNAALYTDSVTLDGWQTNGKCVGTWHISLYVGPDRQGGWHAIDGKAALPAYQNNAGAATAADTLNATTIHQNMNDDIL